MISVDGSGADGIRTWVLQFTGSWLLWTGECEGRRMHEDNEFLRQLEVQPAGAAASKYCVLINTHTSTIRRTPLLTCFCLFISTCD